MSENRRNRMSLRPRRGRNEGNLSCERPTKTPRIDDGEDGVQAQDENPGQGPLSQGQPIPSYSLPSYVRIETFGGITRISMDVNGEKGQTLKQSFIENIQGCTSDLDLICSDGVVDVHRFYLMGVSNLFFRLLNDRDPKDTEAITLDNVNVTHLSLALKLIYTGETTVKEDEEEGVREVLKLFEIKMNLERKEATEEDMAKCATLRLQIAEIVEGNGGGASGNQVEHAEASNNNGNETETNVVEEIANYRAGSYSEPQQMETDESDPEVDEGSDYGSYSDNQVEVDKENDSLPPGGVDDDDEDETGEDAASSSNDTRYSSEDEEVDYHRYIVDLPLDYEEIQNGSNGKSVASAALDESERRPGTPTTIAQAGPGQFDLREPCPTEGQIILNGKRIRWHLMETLPSLTTPDLRHERMRVFTLNIIKMPRQSHRTEIRSLFESLPENSLEKRLGMMAVKCEYYKEIDLVEILHSWRGAPAHGDKSALIMDVEFNKLTNLVRRRQRLPSLKGGRFYFENARYDLASYERIIYGGMIPMEQVQCMKNSSRNIEGLEDRAKALIEMNFAGRTVMIHRFMNPYYGWHEQYSASGVHPEIEGIGWGVVSSRRSDFILNATGTQILFPNLLKDVDLANKVVAEEILKLRLPLWNRPAFGLSPKSLLENGISCFPVVQTPGMLIYKHDDVNEKWTCGISKLRFDMGAEIRI